MKFLLRWEQNGTPEPHAAQYLPMLVDPTQAFAEIAGDLLRGKYSQFFRHKQAQIFSLTMARI
jgi:hypothetical protein